MITTIFVELIVQLREKTLKAAGHVPNRVLIPTQFGR